MRFDAKATMERTSGALSTMSSRLRDWAQSLVEARRRRREHDRQFYAALKVYCRTHNVSPVCEDDWKTRC